MQRIFLFTGLLVLAFTATPALAQNKVQQPMGGIAGNHPYFYRGKTGQDYAQRVNSGFRQLQFQQIRIIPNRSGHRYYISPGYYWNRYGHGYGYRDYYREPVFGYTNHVRIAEPHPARRVVGVGQAQPRVPEDPWAMLAGGHYAEAVGAFAMKAQQGDASANVGYALACAFKGDHGQAAWAMRQAVESGEFASTVKQMTPLRQRLRELASGYESDATLIRWQEDRLFLAASLHHLRGDQVAARRVIEQLEEVSASDAGAKSLRQMITGR